MQSDCLDYRKLPGQNRLFLDYLFNFERVKHLYHSPPSDGESLQERAREVLSSYRYPRPALVAALRTFNQEAGAGEATFRNLERLERPDTVAVVTGQQVGLFGGPAYTLYKAATACRLAAWLDENGVAAVPVFWVAADDSDFEEVRSASFISREAELLTLRHSDTRARAETMAGAATVRLEDQLEPLQRVLSGHPFGEDTLRLLRDCYTPESTFSEAFSRLLCRTFSHQGIVLFDSRDGSVRRGLGDFFATAVRQREAIVARLQERGKELQQLGFEPQVAVDETETLLFYLQGSERYKLKFEHGEFRVKGRKSLRFSPEQLAEAAARQPEDFGFNALLRPILQDSIFPTAIYVGGPAEVGYFAQVNAIAPTWDVRPVILPRASFTLVDRKSGRLLEKYGLGCEQVLCGSEHELAERILHQGEQDDVLKLFASLERSVGQHADDLRRHLKLMDPPLVDMLSNAGAKIDYQISKVRKRFVGNQKLREPALKDHLVHLRNRLRPGDKPQERFFTFAQFLAEVGPELAGQLVERITPDCRSHRIWNL